jgi:hypothetical protein
MLPQARLREISGDIARRHGPEPAADYVALNMVHPRLGHAYWRIGLQSLENLRLRNDREFYDARLILRLYDVTDILFDGANAHHFIDLRTSALSGNYYVNIERTVRDYIAEIGLRRDDGSFCPFARSNIVRFDRDNPAQNHHDVMGSAVSACLPVAENFDTRARIHWASYA